MLARPVLASVLASVLGGGVLAAGVVLASPASAHIEVTGKPAQAAAGGAVLTFVAEAESQTAGITGIRVQLPAGITPGDVSLVSGPPGWRLTSDATSYTVQGAAIKPGQDAAYSVRVARLPDAGSVAFKSIQSYSDGRKDSWIELPGADGAEPDMPAPVLRLAPPAPPAPATTAPATSPATSPPPAATPAASSAPAAAADSDGGSVTPWILGAVLVVALAAGGGYLATRRRSAS